MLFRSLREGRFDAAARIVENPDRADVPLGQSFRRAMQVQFDHFGRAGTDQKQRADVRSPRQELLHDTVEFLVAVRHPGEVTLAEDHDPPARFRETISARRQLLRRLVGGGIDAIASADPGYHAGLDRLRAICENLRDFQHPRVKDVLVGLLASRSDEVRFSALHGLASFPPDEIAAHFAARLLDGAETQRVKSLAWELALEQQLPLQAWAAPLAAVSGPMYRLDADGKVQRA